MKLSDEQAATVEAVPLQLVHAHLWARAGWPVFPLQPSGKEPYPGTHGVLEATRNPRQLAAWWRRWPDANIGGACTGRIVIDLDSYKPEHPAELAGLVAGGLVLPPTRIHRSRGTHRIYRDTTGLAPEQIRGKLAGTVDVKHGPGQYVVLPPSTHPSGKLYRVASSRPEAAVPDGLRTFLERPPGPAPLDGVPEARTLPDRLPESLRKALATEQADRSEHTWHVACAGYRAGLSDGEVVALLEQDETTRQRWDEKPHKRWLELTAMLPRAAELARQDDHLTELPATYRSPAPGEWPALPDEFWNARPSLAHIRLAARASRAGPEAFLLHTLGRVALLTHPRHRGPDDATLDLQGVIVAPPGTGKGRSRKMSARLVPDCNPESGVPFQVRSLGSGEGMTQAYFDWEGEGDERELAQVRWGVLFGTDEGAVWDKYAQRSGQTTIETIRSMFMGESIGGTYASSGNRKVWMGDLIYRAVILISVQPGAVGALLSDWKGGTPQRFLWAPAGDPDAPDARPDWPGPLDWQPVGVDERMRSDSACHPIRIGQRIEAEIDAGLRLAQRYQVEDHYNSHRNLLRMKVAMLLAILDGCLHSGREVSYEDWALAGMFVEMSNATRNRVLGLASADQEQRRTDAITLHAAKAEAAELATQVTRDGVLLVAQRIQRYCKARPEGSTTEKLRDNTKGPRGRDKGFFRAALARAQAENWIEKQEDGRWYAL